ncbi:MAG: DUF4234 domain-containing protein [Roseburia sp.]
MVCVKCGMENRENSVYCQNCGAVLSENGAAGTPVNYWRPALQLPTERALWKMILFGILTCGIYNMVIFCRISGELNLIASRYDGKRTMHYLGMSILGGITFGIYMLVWFHGFSNRIQCELQRRNIFYSFSAKDFWLWNVLGSLILVGPFVYQHKLLKAMNQLCESYNYYG